MKIAIFATTLAAHDGGIARSVPGLACAVQALGHDVTLVYPDFGLALAGDPSALPLRTIAIPLGEWRRHPAFGSAGLLPVLEQLRAEGTDVFHHAGVWSAINHTIASYARRSRIPMVCSPRGQLDRWSLNYKKWKKDLCLWAYGRRDLQSCAFLHATSQEEAGYLADLNLGVPVVVAPNGVDVPDLETLPNKPQNHPRRLLFLSRIHPKKGLDLLINAWNQLRPADWALEIAGPDEGGHQTELERMIDRMGLQGSIVFSGAYDDDAKWRVYRTADAFVLPTRTENFGIVIAEALACETPVLTTEGAPWGFLSEAGCGWSVPISVEGILSGLRELTTTPAGQLQMMGQRGRTLVRQRFAWSVASGPLNEAYGNLGGTR